MLKAIPATTDPDAGFELDGSQAQLHAEQRQVILPVGSEGMSYQDAAEILEIPVGTVARACPVPRLSSPAFGLGNAILRGSAAGSLMLVIAITGLVDFFSTRRHEPAG